MRLTVSEIVILLDRTGCSLDSTLLLHFSYAEDTGCVVIPQGRSCRGLTRADRRYILPREEHPGSAGNRGPGTSGLCYDLIGREGLCL